MADRKQPSNENRLRSSAPVLVQNHQSGSLDRGHEDAAFPLGCRCFGRREHQRGCSGTTSLGRRPVLVSKTSLAIFRQRYLTEESVTKALVTLVRGKFPPAALDRLLYFHSARADRLLHDAVTEILVPMQSTGFGGHQRARISSGHWQSGWRKGRRPAIGPNPRSPALPKDCFRLFGTSVCFKGPSTKDRSRLFSHRVVCVYCVLSETASTIRS